MWITYSEHTIDAGGLNLVEEHGRSIPFHRIQSKIHRELQYCKHTVKLQQQLLRLSVSFQQNGKEEHVCALSIDDHFLVVINVISFARLRLKHSNVQNLLST